MKLWSAAILCVGVLATANASAQVVYGARPAASADARVYTWVDAKGVRHYGDASVATPGEFARSSARDLRLMLPAEQRNGGRSGSAQDSGVQTPPTSTDKMTAGWENGANPGEKLAPTRAAACDVARRNVQVLADNSQPAYIRDASGNPVELDAAGRAARLEQAHNDATSYCAG